MIGLEFKDSEQIYNIFAIEEEKAQPSLIKKSDDILNWLASISSNDLEKEIREGKIIIYSQDQ